MLAPSLRRTVAVAASAAAALFASPLLGNSAAATFAGTMSSTPAANSSGVIAANRPTLTGTFNSALNHSTSTITLVEKGTATNLCGPKTFSSNSLAISCTPTADLKVGKTYDATAHGVSAADSSTTADAPQLEFTVDYPVYARSTPVKDGSLVTSGKITAVYTTDVDLDPAKSKITVKNIINGAPGNTIPGTTSVASSFAPLPGTNDSVVFTPSTALSDGAQYEATVHTEQSGNPNAYADDIIDFTVTNVPVSNLALGAPYANNTNDDAYPFTGIGNVGQTVIVEVDGSPQPPSIDNSPTASAVIPPCGSLRCPFTVKDDISGLTDASDLKWYVHTVDGNGKVTATVEGDPPPVVKDTSAPSTTTPAATLASGSVQLHVTAANPDSTNDLSGYQVKITDSNGHVQGPAIYPVASSADNLDQTINVSGLDDGTLTVEVDAVDEHGNVGSAPSPTPPTGPTGIVKVTKNAGLVPDFTNSTLTAGGADRPLATVSGQAVQRVTKLTIRFEQPVTNWTDNSDATNSVSHKTLLCLEDVTSHNGAGCLNDAATISSTDAHVVTATVSSTLVDAAGYHIWFDAWPKAFCSDVPPQMTPPGNCKDVSGDLIDPSTSRPMTFTVDNTAPTVHFSYITSPITNVRSSAVTGTVDKDVSSIQLAIKSNAQPSNVRVVNVPVEQPQSGNTADWTLTPLPLSGIADGTLTVTATATDGAGNVGKASTTTVLNALSFKVSSGDAGAKLTWRKPELPGGGAPTYTVTYADLTTATSAKTATPSPASSATSYVLHGLANGHVYSITLHAGDNDGNGPSAIGTAKPRYLTAITAKASPAATFVYGTSITLSGQLLAKNYNAGINGQKLTIRPTLYNGKVGTTTTVTTSGAGAWKLAVGRLAKDTTYVIAYAGSSRYTPAARKLLIFVKVSLAITSVSARNSSHTSPVTLRGGVGPNQSGRYVYVYEHTASGNRLLGKVKLSSKSTFAFTHTFGRGRHYVFVKFLTQNGNIGNTSKTVSFSRT